VKGGPQTWDELEEEPVGVHDACISLDGTHIAAVFADTTLCIYDTTTGEAIRPPFKVDEFLRSVIFSRDGKLVATGGKALRLWNVQTGKEVESFDIDVFSLALSPDGNYIAAGCGGGYIRGDGRDGRYNIRIINLELAKIPHPYVPPGGGGAKAIKGGSLAQSVKRTQGQCHLCRLLTRWQANCLWFKRRDSLGLGRLDWREKNIQDR
jgi:WD domain, G-beta repeat